MEIKGYLYKKLTLEMSDDFLCYFDNDAFSDHEDFLKTGLKKER